MSYRRVCDVILLVGLTELKAQVCWIDSKTVRLIRILFPTSARLFTSSGLHVDGDWGTEKRFVATFYEVPLLGLNQIF